MMKNCGMRNSHTEELLEQPCHSQKYVDSVQVKTEDDTDPIWAWYGSLEKQGVSEASGVKTEPLWVKSEAPEFEEANVTRCENFFSVQDRAVFSQTVGIKNEDHIWESFRDCYNSVPGSENQQTESDIKQEIVTIKQECYTASNHLLAMASRTISSPVVTLTSNKDSKSIGDLQNETFTVSNPKSISCVNSVSSYKSPILRHDLDSASQVKDTNQQVARPPDKSQHVVQESCTPQHISPSNTLSQSNLRPAHGANQPHSPSPERAGECSVPQQGGVCLERSASQQKQSWLNFLQVCQQCQKTMRSHYVEGCKHKIPKTSKSKSKARTRNWKCCQCDVAVVSSGRLIYHLMKKHARSRCVHCDMSFNCKNKLAYHIKCRHQPPASCEVCGKVFRSGYHLKVHQATHNKELIKHFCELCGKGFRLRSALQMHMNVHTEEKPYKCPDCKATFKAAFHLSRHRITHTDLRPFSCHVCQNKFKTKAYLKAHLKTHDKDPLKERGKRKRKTRTQKKKKVQLSESEEEKWEEEQESEEKAESVEDCKKRGRWKGGLTGSRRKDREVILIE